IKEVRPAGAQETEESAWTIDREHTFAAGGLITADDADILLNAIDQTLAAGSSTFAAPLADIRSKIAYLTGRTTVDEVPIRRSPTVDAVWSAFAERCALRFLYQNGRGEQKERTVCVYGMFEREGVAYFCGLDNVTDDIRTFRCDRIVRAHLRRPTPSLRTSISTTICSNSISPTDRPLQPRSFALRRRSI
ncbi:MAG: helix-turn-helix transcriptional regulator, partial [Collinsella sp.]